MASTTPTVRREVEAKEGEEKSGKGAIYGVREEWPLLEGGGGHFHFHLIGVAAGNTVASIGTCLADEGESKSVQTLELMKCPLTHRPGSCCRLLRARYKELLSDDASLPKKRAFH